MYSDPPNYRGSKLIRTRPLRLIFNDNASIPLETKESLLRDKKLALILDLDQTLVPAEQRSAVQSVAQPAGRSVPPYHEHYDFCSHCCLEAQGREDR